MMEFVNGKDDIPYMENKSHVPNHQPDEDLWMFTANISQHALDPHFFHKPLVELLRSSSPRSPALQRPREYQWWRSMAPTTVDKICHRTSCFLPKGVHQANQSEQTQCNQEICQALSNHTNWHKLTHSLDLGGRTEETILSTNNVCVCVFSTRNWTLQFCAFKNLPETSTIVGLRCRKGCMGYGHSCSHFWRQTWRSHRTWIQWIGLRENLQENPIFNGNIYGFRLRFSLKPIHWWMQRSLERSSVFQTGTIGAALKKILWFQSTIDFFFSQDFTPFHFRNSGGVSQNPVPSLTPGALRVMVKLHLV